MVNLFHSNDCIYKSDGLIIIDTLNHFCGRHFRYKLASKSQLSSVGCITVLMSF